MPLAKFPCGLVPVGANHEPLQRLAFAERREWNEVGRKNRLVAEIVDGVRGVIVARLLDVE